MSQPIVPPARAGISPSILRRLSRRDVSHDFDVIGDVPPARVEAEKTEQPSKQTAPRAAE